MADSRYQSKNIYVEEDYQNIILVDPNKVVLPDGTVQERLVDHEDLVYYANLQARVLPRTKLAVGADLDNVVQNTTVAEFRSKDNYGIDFLNPQNSTNALDTSWSDQVTGQGSREGQGRGQTQETITNAKQFIRRQRQDLQVDSQGFGIKSISIKLNQAYIPQVSIEMVDVQGRTLFEQGENSPYAAFFNLPYPIFFLTVKGYYGKAVRYELMLKSFNASFDPGTGNYNVQTEFIGRTAAILSDLTIAQLFTLPHMYNSILTVEGQTAGQTQQQVGATSTNGIPTNSNIRINTTKGLQKLNEVYSIYESRGLIEKGFPRLTLNALVFKLQTLDKLINESFGKQDMSVLTDVEKYGTTITNFRENIYGNFDGNWYTKYIDPTDVIILGNKKYYGLKKTLQGELSQQTALTDLDKIIKENVEKLQTNKTFGNQGPSAGTYTINGKTQKSELSFNLSVSNLVGVINPDELTPQDIEQTFIIRKNRVPGPNDNLELFGNELKTELSFSNKYLDPKTGQVVDEPKRYYIFGEPGPNGSTPPRTFLPILDALQKNYTAISQKIEEELSKALAEKIKNSENGLGFNPTIRNIMAVIMASADAFLRLMDEVHRDAWEVRKNPNRLQAIISPDRNFGVDNKDVVQKDNTSTETLSDNNVVYPWPQYFEEEKDDKGNVKFTVKYPGDPEVINRTKGYLWDLWPEVEFTEQYITGSIQKQEIPDPVNYNNELEFTQYIGVNAVEFPNVNQPYLNLTEVSFFYEMWERAYLGSNYTKLFKETGYENELYAAIGEFEFYNIKQAVEESPQLQGILKRFKFNYNNFINFLRNISLGGEGQNWNLFIRDEFVTPYIKEYITQDFEVYSVATLSENSPSVQGLESSTNKISEYIKSSKSNSVSFIDSPPFTDLNWVKTNLANGQSIGVLEDANQTTKSLSFYQDKKSISNIFDDPYYNNFWTSIDWLSNDGSNVTQSILNLNTFVQSNGQAYPTQTLAGLTTQTQLADFYSSRSQKYFFPTESTLNYGNDYVITSGNVTSIQTTSLFNTPYFANAVNKGVELKKQNNDNPYVGLGYLALNSLPLITLREKLKEVNLTNKTVTDLDYLYATFTKFAAIHRVPYAWMLKYGSIWHRYKQFVNNNIDILDDIWDDFPYLENYDPINQNASTQYTFRDYTGGNSTISLQLSIQTPAPIVLNHDSISGGFYPKLINNFYNFFANQDLVSGYTQNDWANAYNQSFRVGKTNQSTIAFGPGSDLTDTGKTFSMVNWYQYYDTTNDPALKYNLSQGYMLFPSTGALNFNQSKFECTNSTGQIVKPLMNNPAVYNGTVRGVWLAPQFGYFDNSLIERPTPLQYLKVIQSGTSEQEAFSIQSESVYSSIEEVLGVFKPEILDLFENYFLKWCEPITNLEDITDPFKILESATSFFSSEDKGADLYYSNLYTLMMNFFIVPKVTLTGQENKDGSILATSQMGSITTYIRSFLNLDVVLKLGNPSNFNRKIFGSFTNNTNLQPVDKINFGPYVVGSVPGDAGTTLAQSINNFPDVWNALENKIGFSTISGLTYSNSGSYYTDFFKDFGIAFTEPNVNDLYQIIKMYGSAKLANNSLTTAQFYTAFSDFLTLQEKFQFNAMNHTFIQLNKNLPNVTETRVNNRVSSLDGKTTKLEIWETFKNFNDKWIAGGDFQTRTLFEDFLFMDRGNRDVGNQIIVDVISLLGYLQSQTASFSLYALIGEILSKNNFIFFALPSYINFYGIQTAVRTPGSLLDPEIANSAFGTYLTVDYQNSKPKFLCMYVDKPSEHLDLKENQSVRFKTDTFDLRRGVNNPILENQENKTDWAFSNKVVGFNLDFGIRNQNMFQSISLNQNQFKNTAESFQVLVNLGNQASGDKVAQQSQSLYNVYRSRSYTCEVVSLGNAMIQPTMYFNLRHVPMFTGPYLITNVSHSINENGFNTQFTGVRVPIYTFPDIDSLVMSVNKDLLQRYRERFRTKASVSGSSENASNTTNSGTTANGQSSALGVNQPCRDLTKYQDLDFVDTSNTVITKTEIKNYLSTLSVSDNLKIYAYGVTNIKNGTASNTVVQCNNNNLFGILTSVQWKGSQSTYIDSQTCIQQSDGQTKPLASFDSFTGSIDFFISLNNNFSGIITNLIRLNANTNQAQSIADALTQLYISTWVNNYGYNKSAVQIQQEVIGNIGTKITQQEYDAIKIAFYNAVIYLQ